MLTSLWRVLSHDVAIDLGTANTLVWVQGLGVTISEPSVVAKNVLTGAIIAVGSEAKRMMGKTPKAIEIIRPLKDGVIADFDSAEALLAHYIRRIQITPGWWHRLIKPRVALGIPSGVTEVERRAVHEAAMAAGAREAHLIEEPMATALGADLGVLEPQGRMVVDIGGGTAEIAVISLGGLVINRSIRIAGDELDEAIVRFVRVKYGLLIGESTAEHIKWEVGSAYRFEKNSAKTADGVLYVVVRGRDLGSGLPRSVKLSSVEIREGIISVVMQIVQAVRDVLEETPPELVGDILEQGITLGGGSSLLRGLDTLISEETHMPVKRMDEPLLGVVRGCARALTDDALLSRVRVK